MPGAKNSIRRENAESNARWGVGTAVFPAKTPSVTVTKTVPYWEIKRPITYQGDVVFGARRSLITQIPYQPDSSVLPILPLLPLLPSLLPSLPLLLLDYSSLTLVLRMFDWPYVLDAMRFFRSVSFVGLLLEVGVRCHVGRHFKVRGHAPAYKVTLLVAEPDPCILGHVTYHLKANSPVNSKWPL